MLAVDTNVVVRLLVADDEDQHARARRLFTTRAVWIPTTVVLETEWVLRSAYGFAPDAIATALSRLVRLADVTVENVDAVTFAIDALDKGIDFADALHLASSTAAATEGLATFDTRFVRRAQRHYPHLTITTPDRGE